jgi:hypothetical protein
MSMYITSIGGDGDVGIDRMCICKYIDNQCTHIDNYMYM